MTDDATAVAIVGMAGRFPGAGSVDELWQNLLVGLESVTRLSPEELAAAGVDPELIRRPEYVPVAADLSHADCFDGEFFGVPAHEAQLMDPQQRVFLECAWSALEDAGYGSGSLPLRTGVFGSSSASSYLVNVLAQTVDLGPGEVSYPVLLGNDKDFLATRVSYRLGLTGPSLTVQTSCSSSLTAVHLACRSLAEGECSIALAGGVSITVPQGRGYLYREAGILSADGRCRVFDADAGGTVKGNGCGVVALRMLPDALADGDHIYAVIRGTAINNDGADKVGFTAPSSTGQAEVIREALCVAGVPAEDIGYVEAHGTGTALGDPIEVRALAAAHRADGPPPRSCVLGSLKANIGHLDAAAGVTGLIKTALVLKHKVIPGQPTFSMANPALDLAEPYEVLQQARPATDLRAAAVSSFGLGGTNAHAVLAPAQAQPREAIPPGSFHVLLSSTDEQALADDARRLHSWLTRHPDTRIDDVTLTLARGRKPQGVRAAFAVRDTAELLAALAAHDSRPSSGDDPLHRLWASGDDSVADHVGDLSCARRVPLPGRAFRRVTHWAEPSARQSRSVESPEPAPARRPVGQGADGTATLDRVRQVIGGTLGVEVGPDDDIFDLGVDSITLVEVVTELRDELGVPLGFEDVEQAGTIRRIAEHIAEAAGAATRDADSRRLCPVVRRGSGDRALFLVHPAGGTTVCYSDLSRRLESDITAYGIGYPDGLASHEQTIRALARRYVALVREVQPHGPYLIGGYSFGGNVAFEMALILQEQDEEVEQVIMFDSHPPEAYLDGAVPDAAYLDAFPHLLRSLFPEVPVPVTPGAASIAEIIDQVRRPSWSDSMVQELAEFFEVWRQNHGALKRYLPDRKLSTDVTIFAATEPEDPYVLQRLGIRETSVDTWRRHISGALQIVPVPGDHYSIFRDAEHLKALAATLDRELR